MNVYLTKEFYEISRLPMFPINGFKMRLVRYMEDFDPTTVSQGTLFNGYSTYSDCILIPHDEGLRILFDLADDPTALGVGGTSYYNGVVVYYFDIIDNMNKVAMLIDDPEPKKLVNGLNAINLKRLIMREAMIYTDQGMGGDPILADKVTSNSGFMKDSRIHNLYKILNEGMVSSEYSEMAYIAKIPQNLEKDSIKLKNDLLISK